MKNKPVDQNIGSFIKEAMYRYGTEVIENRALPRIEDGLKPGQRHVIWATHKLNTNHFVKCAKVVGLTIAEYSPHGDIATYGTLVNMIRSRYTPFTGQGNFGCELTSAASQRYSECKLSPFFKLFSTNLPDVDVVPYEKNFDETRDQPVYLPTLLPYLLLFGSEGIAVATTCKIPEFNMKEICEALATYILSKDINKALKKIKAPDGFDCTLVSTKAEVDALFKSGDGTLEYECRHTLVANGKKGFLLTITGYTPEFPLESFLSRCGKLSDEDVIDFVRNETSAKNGKKIILAFKDKATYDKKILPMLRKKINYKFNVLFPKDGGLRPKLCSLANIIEDWVAIRKNTIMATLVKKEEDLQKLLSKEEAKRKAILNLDDIFKALKSDIDFKVYLQDKLKLTLEQAIYISDMRVEALKKATLLDAETQIVKLNNNIAEVISTKKDIDSVIIEQIKTLVSWVNKNVPEFMTRKIIVSF
jgi:DNA gyrase/topoisomerase IV subunit A